MGMVSDIIKYEGGYLGTFEVVELFGLLIRSGMIDKLQGAYGRSANTLIESGFLTESGQVTEKARKELNNE